MGFDLHSQNTKVLQIKIAEVKSGKKCEILLVKLLFWWDILRSLAPQVVLSFVFFV
jgi:hypothetical protein